MTEPYMVMVTIDCPGHPLDFYTHPFKLWGDAGQAKTRAREIAEEIPHAISWAIVDTHGTGFRVEL